MARTRFLLPLAALALTPLVGAQLQFSYTAAALPAQNIWTDGVAIADVDADGDNDILFANGNVYGGVGGAGAQAQHLFLNNGAGTFVAGHANLNVANFNAKMVIAEDFDSDGDLDLFYASGSTGSPPRLLINQGNAQAGTTGIFADVTATNVPALALRSFSICAGDVDDDGDLDVVVTDGGTFGGTPSQALLLTNNGNAVFTNVTATNMPADLYNAQDVTLLDYDGDYDVDIALSGKGATGKRGRLYLNNGSGVFTVNTVLDAIGTGATYEWDWADLDGDSDFDASVQSVTGQSEGWGRNLGTGSAMTTSAFPAPNGNDDNEMAQLDYDNDGDLDVFVASLAGTEKAYRNNGNATFTNVNAIIQAQSDASLDVGFGDLNGDDRYDMVTAQGESGNFTDKVYMNSGAADTLGPVLIAAELPVISNPVTVAHLRASDSIADDGQCNIDTLVFDYLSNIGSSGQDGATHMGNGLFRAELPSAIGTTWIWVKYTATDAAGNVSTFGPFVLGTPPNPWTDIGFGLAGVSGIPSLVGTGPLLEGTAGAINLSNANPSAAALLFLSLASTPVPFKGGMLAAFPFFATVNLVTSPTGTIPLPFVWPAGVPSGVSLYFQYAINDPAGVAGASLSNAEQGTTP
jgi:hypothetical protein